MADDLDELLDEVESKFCRNVSVTSSSPSDIKESIRKTEGKGGTHCSAYNVAHKYFDEDDIDSLLADILDDGDPLNLDIPKATKSDCKTTLSQPAHRRACSQLRCTSCDFRVISFDDYEWDSSCDYLFFRNNMPDRRKLQAKLRRKRTARAYACQCSWRSTLILTDLRDQPELKWVCGKHDA